VAEAAAAAAAVTVAASREGVVAAVKEEGCLVAGAVAAAHWVAASDSRLQSQRSRHLSRAVDAERGPREA